LQHTGSIYGLSVRGAISDCFVSGYRMSITTRRIIIIYIFNIILNNKLFKRLESLAIIPPQ
jgi:hypothetical protein